MAADYCAAPATNVPSEEVFSAASDLITKRNRMAPDTAEARMCARYWLEFPELTDEDWAEAQQKERALLARLEEQDARLLAQSASESGGAGEDGDAIADELGDSDGRGDGAGEGVGFSGRGGSGRASRGAGSGGGAGGTGSGTGSGDESSSLSSLSGLE
jgi:hypothetical protein